MRKCCGKCQILSIQNQSFINFSKSFQRNVSIFFCPPPFKDFKLFITNTFFGIFSFWKKMENSKTLHDEIPKSVIIELEAEVWCKWYLYVPRIMNDIGYPLYPLSPTTMKNRFLPFLVFEIWSFKTFRIVWTMFKYFFSRRCAMFWNWDMVHFVLKIPIELGT